MRVIGIFVEKNPTLIKFSRRVVFPTNHSENLIIYIFIKQGLDRKPGKQETP